MAPPSSTRRSVLRAGGSIAAILGTGGLAGCVEGIGNAGNGETAGSDRIHDVPPTADAVFSVDANTFFADDGVHNTYNAWLETRTELDYYDGPTSLAETFEDFEQTEGVDLRDLSRFTAFFAFGGEGTATSNDGSGYVLEGGWDESEFVSLFDNEYAGYTETTYGEHTIYEPAEDYTATLAVLEDGRYVAGGPDAARGAIDVERGETDPLDGPITDAYGETTPGPVRFATPIREEWVPAELEGGDSPLDLSPLRNVETAAGAIYRDGNTRGLRVSLAAPDASSGEDLEGVVDASITLAKGQAAERSTPDFVVDLLEDLSVDRDGASVALSVERTVEELEAMAAEYGEFTTGSASGGGGSRVETPQVAFEFEYESGARTVTITHTSGDNVPAENLYVDGEEFATVEGVDMTEPGEWAGTSTDGNVIAGDSVTVGVEPDGTVYLVWQDGDTAASMAHWAGPEA